MVRAGNNLQVFPELRQLSNCLVLQGGGAKDDDVSGVARDSGSQDQMRARQQLDCEVTICIGTECKLCGGMREGELREAPST